jgi:hypothetical protein
MADEVVLRPREGSRLEGGAMEAGDLEQAFRWPMFAEIGATGLKRAAGFLDEEFLPALRGRKGVEVYREMSQNDPTVSAMLFTIDRLLRNVDWNVQPAGKTTADEAAAKFVESCMDDMSQSWGDFVSEALSCVTYGWSWHEVVWKRRVSPWEADPRKRSKYTDGLVGIRKMPIRSQDTLLRWVFDESGETRAMVQIAPPLYQTRTLPIERSLLFRYRHYKGSPEGISMLRGAYRPWFFKKRLEEFEAIGVERDLAGLPIVKVPSEMLRARPGTDQAKSVDAFKKLVKSVRRNEQEGVVFPAAYDQETKQPLYSFELLGGGGARAFNTDAIIQRYEQRILMTVLADFIMVGHEETGSYSLHVDKTGVFRTALNSIAQSIADTLNRHLIPRLFAANQWKPMELPTIVPTDVDAPDIAVLAQFMSAMSMMGVQWFPDGELENFVRSAARLPELDEDQLEARKQMQMRAEATAFANANAEYVQSQQMLTQSVLGGGQPEQDQRALPPGRARSQGSAGPGQQARGAGVGPQGPGKATPPRARNT